MPNFSSLRKLVTFKNVVDNGIKNTFGHMIQGEQTVNKVLQSGKNVTMKFHGGELIESKIHDPHGMLLKVKKYSKIGRKHSFTNIEKGNLKEGTAVFREGPGKVESSLGDRLVIYRAKPELKDSNPLIIRNLNNKAQLPISQIYSKQANSKPVIRMYEYDKALRKNVELKPEFSK